MSVRRSVSVVLALSLAAASLVGLSIPASADPVTEATWTYTRGSNPDGVSVDVETGEFGLANFSVSVGPEWSGWGHPKKKIYTFTAPELTVTDGESGVLEWAFPLRQWYGYSTTNDRCWKTVAWTNKFVLPKSTCVDTVVLLDGYYFFEPLSDAVTLSSDIDTLALTGNGVVVAADDDRFTDVSFNAEVGSRTAITVDTATVSSLSYSIDEMCVDESLFTNGDEAVHASAVSFDGSPIDTAESVSDPWVDLWPANGDTEELWGDEYVTSSSYGVVTTPDVGVVTVTVSADFTIGGSSVLEPCSLPFAGPLDTTTNTGSPAATDVTLNLPTPFAWTDGAPAELWPDGFGEMFAVSDSLDMTSGETTYTVSHLGTSGDNDAFADGSGAYEFSLTDGELLQSITRFGTGGDHLLAAYSDATGDALTFLSGPMATGPLTETTVSDSTLSTACGRPGATADWVDVISTPTEDPFIEISCSYKASRKSPLVSIVGFAFVNLGSDNSITPVGSVPDASMGNASVYEPYISVNPEATGSETAVWIYSQSTKDKKAGQESRVTIASALGSVATTVLDAPLFGSKGIQWLSVVPGATDGTWVGYVDQSYWKKRRYVENISTVRIVNNARLDSSAPFEIVYTDEGDEVWTTIVSMHSDDEFGQMMFGRTWFDGAVTGTARLNMVNVDSGETAHGEDIDIYDPTQGYEPLILTSDSYGDPHFYWLASETEYQVVTWNLP